MVEIDRLETQWNRALGPQQEGFYNYHPVLARWKYEKYQKENIPTEEFKLAESPNVVTSLRERDHTEESRLRFVIEGNKIRAEFEYEPHETTILRGLDYRKTHGSEEVEREEQEVAGFQFMQDILISEETPVGTMFAVISGPGLIKGTQYEDNFVDFWKLEEDESKRRYISYVRFSSALNYERYQQAAKTLVPNYFDGFDEKKDTIDAWLLGHPILIMPDSGEADEIFDLYFEKDPKAMKEKVFLERLKIYQPYIQHYLNVLTERDFNPIKIAASYNSIQLSPEYKAMQVTDLKEVAQKASEFGWMQPIAVRAGCGISAGFRIGGENFNLFANSVGKFGLQDYTGENAKNDPNLCKCGGAEPHFHCEGTSRGHSCREKITVGKGITKCPACGEGKKC